jgi:nucleotide-binding universal stress UspA family protein
MKIVIGYDGSSCADSALEDLSRAGLPQKAEALVISVAELRLPPPPPSSYGILSGYAVGVGTSADAETSSRVVDDAQALAFQASRLIQASFPGWEVRHDGRPGSPAGEIIEKAERWGADLIVVGSHGRSALGRLILGSVSQRVVTEAHCSVRVARSPRAEKDAPVRIVLGVDGSEHSGAAVRAVAARKWPERSEVRLVTSVDPLHMYGADPADKYTGVLTIHKSAEIFLRDAGLEVSSVAEEKDAQHLLVREAEEWGADSIFVGARGLGRLGRLLLGSVSTAVVARAHCTVEVIRTA